MFRQYPLRELCQGYGRLWPSWCGNYPLGLEINPNAIRSSRLIETPADIEAECQKYNVDIRSLRNYTTPQLAILGLICLNLPVVRFRVSCKVDVDVPRHIPSYGDILLEISAPGGLIKLMSWHEEEITRCAEVLPCCILLLSMPSTCRIQVSNTDIITYEYAMVDYDMHKQLGELPVVVDVGTEGGDWYASGSGPVRLPPDPKNTPLIKGEAPSE